MCAGNNHLLDRDSQTVADPEQRVKPRNLPFEELLKAPLRDVAVSRGLVQSGPALVPDCLQDQTYIDQGGYFSPTWHDCPFWDIPSIPGHLGDDPRPWAPQGESVSAVCFALRAIT